MRVAARAAGAGILAVVAAVLLVLTSTTTSVFTLAATTALIMGGTGDPLSTPKDTIAFIEQYMGMAVDNYISPSSTAAPATGIPEGPYNQVAVITPEQLATSPDSGTLTFDQSVAEGKRNLDNCIKATDCLYNTEVESTAPASNDTFVVFGYSQSATIGTLEKRSLAAEYPDGGGPDVSFVFIGNGNRPNGGFLARGPQGFTIPFPLVFGGATFSGPAPTNTQYSTVDIVEQYDAWADVPVNPLNLLAVANWYSSSVHYNYPNDSLSDPGVVYQGQLGDTTYYMVPTPILPLLTQVQQVPLIGYPLADTLDAPLRVLVEAGYNRTASPGQPIPWNPLYFPNPITLGINFVVAIPTGLDNGLQDIIGIRPFGTQRPGPYGVGGPDVTYVNPPATSATTQRSPDPAAAAGLSFEALREGVLREGVQKGGSNTALSPPYGAMVAADASALAPAATLLSSAWKPGDGIRAAAGVVRHSASGGIADDVPGSAATTPSFTGRKPGDRIKAAVGPIKQSFSGNTHSTATTTGRPTSVTSTTTRSEASSSMSSSPGSDSAPRKRTRQGDQ